MATLQNLNVSILSMKPEEAFALVKRLRESRRIQKNIKVIVKRDSAVSRVSKPKTPKDFASALSAEQKAMLLKLLTKED